MINPIYWKDHVTEFPYRFVETDLGEGYTQIEKAQGEVIQQGTPMNAANFNNLDKKGLEGIMLGLVMAQYNKQLTQKVEGLEGEQISVTMTNTKAYPFNDSKKTVALTAPAKRVNNKYTVLVEVVSVTGGHLGDIEITNKLENGFKIAFTGSATSVTVNCIVQGGM